MKLSKKNPLRLLLPLDASESTDNGVISTQPKTATSPTDVSAGGPSFAFNLPESNIIQAQNSKCLTALPQTTPVVADEDQESWREPLPFSTPGPGSLLGSSVASNTVFSLPVRKKYLSPVSYENNIHLPSSRSHTPLYCLSSDPATCYDPYIETFAATDDVGSTKNPSKLEGNHQSLFSNIFSTPGPGYYAPRPVHFDSSLEDPVNLDPLQPAYEIDYDAIDFHWKPFDRKHLVVPQASHFQKPIYISGPAHSDFGSDTSEYKPAYAATSRPANTETNKLHPYISPASPLQSTSPNPFRFLPPPETDASILVPESQIQNAVQEPSTPKKSSYFALPGVYISPLALDEDRKIYDTVSNTVVDLIIMLSCYQAAIKKHARHHDADTSNNAEQVNSQASNDSIESWEEDLF